MALCLTTIIYIRLSNILLTIYSQKKKKLFQILLSNNGDISLQKDILTVFAEKILQTDIQMLNDRCELLQEYIFSVPEVLG